MRTWGGWIGKENFSTKWIRARGGVAVSIHASILIPLSMGALPGMLRCLVQSVCLTCDGFLQGVDFIATTPPSKFLQKIVWKTFNVLILPLTSSFH